MVLQLIMGNRRSKLSLMTCLFMLSAVVTLNPTAATAQNISNGTNCAKSNSSVKVGNKSYRCAKNPYVKPTRTTWTLRGCLTAYAMWKDAKEQYADWVDLAKLAGEQGQKTMDELQASIIELESTMKDVVCKRGA
jgi:hypothetical protein